MHNIALKGRAFTHAHYFELLLLFSPPTAVWLQFTVKIFRTFGHTPHENVDVSSNSYYSIHTVIVIVKSKL